MNRPPRIVPADVIESIERFVSGEHETARKFDNREPLDDSGVYDLHTLAATIYARGWDDGERAQAARDRGQRQRERDASP